jgi:hypothetical protein
LNISYITRAIDIKQSNEERGEKRIEETTLSEHPYAHVQRTGLNWVERVVPLNSQKMLGF